VRGFGSTSAKKDNKGFSTGKKTHLAVNEGMELLQMARVVAVTNERAQQVPPQIHASASAITCARFGSKQSQQIILSLLFFARNRSMCLDERVEVAADGSSTAPDQLGLSLSLPGASEVATHYLWVLFEHVPGILEKI
jgi:hypothetical protein